MEIPEEIPKRKLIAFSGEHLYYEIRMLYGVSRLLKEGPSDIYVFNALLESFVVHASIVLDFFYRPQIFSEEAKAEHFMSDPKKWKKALPRYSENFRKFHSKRNREVVHLSYKRLDVKAEEKRWGSQKLTKEIQKIVDLFLDEANPKLIHPRLSDLRSKTDKTNKRKKG